MWVGVHACMCVCVCICVCVCDMCVHLGHSPVHSAFSFKQSLLVRNQITRVKGNHVTSDSDIDTPRSAEEENRTIKGPMPLTAACFCAFLLLANRISF